MPSGVRFSVIRQYLLQASLEFSLAISFVRLPQVDDEFADNINSDKLSRARV